MKINGHSVTFKKQPSEKGLARIGQGPRGYIITIDGIQSGTIGAYTPRMGDFTHWRWVWYACNYNSAAHGKTFTTLEEAKENFIVWYTDATRA